MKKKTFGSLIVIAIVAVAIFNLNLNTQENDLSALSLANVEALAGENDTDTRKCIQNSSWVNDTEMCSSYPLKYRKKIGTSYSLKKDQNGTLTSGKSGFTGTITNECAVWPSPTKIESTASTVNC
jgi:hypothetical protein